MRKWWESYPKGRHDTWHTSRRQERKCFESLAQIQKNNLNITNHATRFSFNCFNQLKRVCSHVLMSSIMPASIFQRSFLQDNYDFKAGTDTTLSTQSILTITFSTFSANGKTKFCLEPYKKRKNAVWLSFLCIFFSSLPFLWLSVAWSKVPR